MTADNRRNPGGLDRGRVVRAAIRLVQRDGLDALTMRALADELGVKAASLYWHVRDRDELLDLLAAGLLAEVPLKSAVQGWRREAMSLCASLQASVARRRDAWRVLVERPSAVAESAVHARLARVLAGAGLPQADASAVATMMLTHVLIAAGQTDVDKAPPEGKPVLVAVDTGSRGVTLRAGARMTGLIRVAHDPAAAAPAVIHGDRVVVRRLRGAGSGELELNPAHPWRIQVQAPTWNTVLDLRGLDVREIKVDSGAGRVEMILPQPRGVVPIDISSGVVGVQMRRPPGVAVVADVSTGGVRTRLDGKPVSVATDTHWESAAGSSGDHYRLKINSGTVRVTLAEDPSVGDEPREMPLGAAASPGPMAALEVVLDGVERRAEG